MKKKKLNEHFKRNNCSKHSTFPYFGTMLFVQDNSIKYSASLFVTTITKKNQIL